jgi:hypothetical protein
MTAADRGSYTAPSAQLAFLFRSIPVNERRLPGRGPAPKPAFHFRSIPVNERQLPGRGPLR